MASNDNLKPCPFCGGSAEVNVKYSISGNSRYKAYVKCAVCGARSKGYAYSNEEKIGEIDEDNMGVKTACFAWNRRA